MIATKHDELAAHFTAILKEWLSDYEWREMVQRQRREKDKNICHSHDFCDANEAMDRAFSEVYGRNAFFPSNVDDGICDEAQVEADCNLINEAWSLAKDSWLAGEEREVTYLERPLGDGRTQVYSLDYHDGKVTAQYALITESNGEYSLEDTLDFDNEAEAMQCLLNWAEVDSFEKGVTK